MKSSTTAKLWSGLFESEKHFLGAMLAFCYPRNHEMAVATRYVMYTQEHHKIPEPSEFENSDVLIEKYHDWEGLLDKFCIREQMERRNKEEVIKEKKAIYAYQIR